MGPSVSEKEAAAVSQVTGHVLEKAGGPVYS